MVNGKSGGKKKGGGSGNNNNNTTTPRSSNNTTSTPRTSKEADKPAKSAKLINTTLADKCRYEKCPCEQSDKSAWMIKCSRCPQDWHNNCANLRGINASFVEQLEDWLCPLCFTAPGAVVRDNMRMESILLKMAELGEYNTSLQKSIEGLENRLSAMGSDMDSLCDTQGQISKRVVTIKDIESHMQHQCINQTQIETRIKTFDSSLTKLQSQVEDYQTTITACPPLPAATVSPVHASASTEHVHDPTPPHHDMTPSSSIVDSFIDEDPAKSISEFLGKCTFNDENGHSVITFGHPYSYTGSKSSSDTPTIPAILQPVFEKINSLQTDLFHKKYPDLVNKCPAPQINSCLVNRYDGPDSHLPKHSDKEVPIHPESSIFTVSLGQTCSIQFTEKANGADTTLTCPDRSLYHMT